MQEISILDTTPELGSEDEQEISSRNTRLEYKQRGSKDIFWNTSTELEGEKVKYVFSQHCNIWSSSKPRQSK